MLNDRLAGASLGPYRILSTLGSGGMGTVYLAALEREPEGMAPGLRVALKVVHRHLVDATSGYVERFLREAEAGGKIDHPNVVRTWGAGRGSVDGADAYYIVMEYVEGQTLGAVLDVTKCPVPENLCRHIGREVAKGLAAIHTAGIVHRDLKLDNIIVTADDVVKIMDFGLAFIHGELVRLSQSGMFVGSLHYASPEQIHGTAAPIDARSDLYSLGWVLYALAAGSHPLQDLDPRSVMHRQLVEEPRRLSEWNARVTPLYETIVHRLLAKDPAGRFASAEEVAEVLRLGESSAWWRQVCESRKAPVRGGVRRIPVPRETALFGRGSELLRLREVFDAAAGGDGGVVLIDGEAGIGKRRLLDEFLGALEEDGCDFTVLSETLPLVRDPAEAGSRWSARGSTARAGSREELILAQIAAASNLRPHFGGPLGLEDLEGGDTIVGARTVRRCLEGFAQSVTAEGPAVIVLQDLHAAAEEGLALFVALGEAIRGRRILLVGTSRSAPPGGWLGKMEGAGGFLRLSLRGLSPDDLAGLLSDALGSGSPDPGLLEFVVRRTEGNPLFALELLRRLRGSGGLSEHADGTWRITEDAAGIDSTSTIRDLLADDISGLGPQDRDVLEMAACEGFEFDPVLVGDALGVSPIPVLRQLNDLEEKKRLVRAVGDRYVFEHRMLHELLLKRIPPALVRQYEAALEKARERKRGSSTGRSPGANAGGRMALPSTRGDGKARILIVDDTDSLRSLLREQVIALGHEPLVAENGIAGLARIRRELPDLVLLDLEMPGLDGRDVLARVRQGDRTRDIPVIVVTGLTDNSVAVQCLESGADDFIVKPFDSTLLRARIRPCLERRMQRIREAEFARKLEEHNLQLEDRVREKTRDLERAHARLSDVDGAKDGFLSLIAHELRTPLTGLIASSEMIVGDPGRDDGLGELRSIFRGSLGRLNRIIEDALLLTELRLADRDFTLSHHCVNDVLQAASTATSEFAAGRQVGVSILAIEGRVAGEQSLLERAFAALLECAVKFCEPGQVVEVSGLPRESEVVVQIRTPAGTIPREELPKFFDAFSIADPITPGGDLGLGPAVAARVLRLLGGSVTVQSISPEGIVFTVRLRGASAVREGGPSP